MNIIAKHPFPWKVSDGFYVIDALGIPVCKAEPLGLSDEAQRSAHEVAKLIASTTDPTQYLTAKEIATLFPSLVLKDGKPHIAKFGHVKVGDRVKRDLGGVEMTLTVEEVTGTLIKCSGGWDFDRITGAEVDEDLGWGPDGTGSYLVREEPCR